MNSKVNFCMIIISSTLCINSVRSDDLTFSVVSTSKPPFPPYLQNDEIIFEDQFEIRKSLTETKHRLERFELKMTQIQRYLETVLKLHNVKIDENLTSDPTDFSKIERIVEEKLKSYKPCAQIDDKLDQLKDDLINQIDKKHEEQANLAATSLNEAKQDIIKKVDAFEMKWTSTNKQLDLMEMFEKSLGPQTTEQVIVLPVDNNNNQVPKNCKEILERGNKETGVYTIKPPKAAKPFKVLCDMDTKGGGWTYFMRRFNGSQNFFQNWEDYKNGFGDLEGEFWLGLEHLYELTGDTINELLFVLTDWEGKTVKSHFKEFRIGNEKERYALDVIRGYSGDGGQSFMSQLKWKFSTGDKQDAFGSCVNTYHGPWWYGPGCFHVKLTGKYLRGKTESYAEGIHYSEFHGFRYSLKKVKMMVRA
ncbi:ficolin-2-like [Zophobas morio]|uniref:ficolin-2-like n=1 Tax=Zophobas morio TaxID=2755281 RepID=UPI003083E5A4